MQSTSALGWASLGLGLPQVAAPGRVVRAIGVRDDPEARAWTLAVGVRELAAAAGLLALRRPHPSVWLWGRVAGDAMDLALLARALRARPADPARVAGAIGAVAAIAAADVLTALRTSRAPDQSEEEPVKVKTALTVRRPREELYAFWRDFENLPGFMAHLQEVRTTDATRSHWTTRAPLGRTVEWDAEVVDDRPGELIAWRSLQGADVDNSGVVRFTDAPGDQGTEVRLEMEVAVPGGPLGQVVAKLFGEEPRQQVTDDLRRFKQLMETGEVVRSEGSPEGVASGRFVRQRPARPLETTGDAR